MHVLAMEDMNLGITGNDLSPAGRGRGGGRRGDRADGPRRRYGRGSRGPIC